MRNFIGIVSASILTLAAFSAEKAEAQTASPENKWVGCEAISTGGSQPRFECNVPTDAIVTMRYGVSGNYIFFTTSGIETVSCDTKFLGDPAPFQTKTCEYTTEDFFGIGKIGDSGWGGIAPQGKFQAVNWGPSWLRYGIDGRYYYTVISGPGPQTGLPAEVLDCSLGAISNGFDPYPGKDKQCQWQTTPSLTANGPVPAAMNELRADTASDTYCANGGSVCNFGTGSPVLVRYGAFDKDGFGFNGVSKFTYRFMVRTSAENFPCNQNWDGFNVDPWAGKKKNCQVAALSIPSQTVQSTGRWVEVGSCRGATCELGIEYRVGSSTTDEWSSKKEWATTVEASFMKKGSFFFGEGEVTTTISSTLAKSTSISRALERNITKVSRAGCNRGSIDSKIALWQFQISTTAQCLEYGNCSGITLDQSYICASDTPVNYKPLCLPTLCEDELCTKCSAPE